MNSIYGSERKRQARVTKDEELSAIDRARQKGPIVFWKELNSVALQLTAILLPRRSLMNLHLQFLRPSNALGALQSDGWEFLTSGIHYQRSPGNIPPLQKIETESETWIFAKHAEVPDEIAARKRLDRLGLLTSASIRIDFRDFRTRILAAS